jgi:hypothetical protein
MSQATNNHYPNYAFRPWHGMGAKAWFGLLARNRFAVSARRLPIVAEVSAYSLLNSTLGALERSIFEKRIATTTIDQPPIFIIGHWRAGTTLLHELLTLDERFTAPTTYECFAPGHFIITSWLAKRLTWLLPSRRPMDDIAMGWDRPQEDEFALLNLGVGSFYETIAFPNHRPVRRAFIGLAGLSQTECEAWQKSLVQFLKRVLWRRRKERQQTSGIPLPAPRLVLKSPTHTAQIDTLLKLFPNAQFIHILRDPFELFSSTVRLWQVLCHYHGLQVPRWEGSPAGPPSIENFVLETFEYLYTRFAEHQALIPPERYCEVRYENLIRDPLSELARIYRHLELGSFESVRIRHEAHLGALAQYQSRRDMPDDANHTLVASRWSAYMERFGYAA